MVLKNISKRLFKCLFKFSSSLNQKIRWLDFETRAGSLAINALRGLGDRPLPSWLLCKATKHPSVVALSPPPRVPMLQRLDVVLVIFSDAAAQLRCWLL